MNSVVITGASSGIGASIAKLFNSANNFTILCGRNSKRLNEAHSLLAFPENAKAIPGDLCNPSYLSQLYDVIKNIHQAHPLTTLINNAGIFARHSVENSDGEWVKMFETNLFSAVRLTEKLIPLLKESKTASIVNVTSTLGILPIPMTSAYSASKAAMNNWTKSLALELASVGIRANAVAPGIVETPIHDFFETEDQGLRDQLNKMQPLGTVGTPEDIAKACLYLGSPDSKWVTGSILNVDGGILLQSNP